MNALNRENKLFIAAGGNVLFIITLFLSWFKAGSATASGWDGLPSSWLILIVALVAAAIFAAEAVRVALPPVLGLQLATLLTGLNLYITVLKIFEGQNGYAAFLALIFIVVALVFAVLVARDER